MEQQYEDHSHDEEHAHAHAGAAGPEHEAEAAPSLGVTGAGSAPAAGPAVTADALASAVEGGAGGAEQAHGSAPTAAPSAIDHQRAAAERQRFTEREQARAKETTRRNQGRLQERRNGELVERADWTAEELRRRFGARGAGGLLVELNERKPQQGIAVLKQINLWDPLIEQLPRGGGHRHVRIAMDQMVADEVVTLQDAIKLFLPRFNHAAEEISGHWTMNLMKGMWRQLAALPPQDVSKNTAITTFQAIAGGGGFGPSWEAPDTINTIQIGEDNIDGEYLEHTVRHEVGHGVHTQIPGPVNSWLQNDMQFWFTDWDTWIQELGGYPQKFWHSSGQWVNVDDAWKGALRDIVRTFTGSSSWSPARATPEAGLHPDLVAAWQAMPAAVKNACLQSKPYWYDNYQNFQAANGKRYFLNHWYNRPFTIGNKAFSTVASTNDTYTAMSEKEFFANCYAEYFADPAGVHDQSKWGGTLPADVKAFFKTCIVQRHPYSTFQKKQREEPAG